MSSVELCDVLSWCWVANIGILSWWWPCLVAAHGWIYEIHNRLIGMSIGREQFDAIQYAGLAFYKMLNIVFFFVPWIALQIIP